MHKSLQDELWAYVQQITRENIVYEPIDIRR